MFISICIVDEYILTIEIECSLWLVKNKVYIIISKPKFRSGYGFKSTILLVFVYTNYRHFT